MTRTLPLAVLAAMAVIASASAAPAPVAKVDVGVSSGLLLSAGGAIWTTDLVIPKVRRVDPTSKTVTKRMKAGTKPFGLAYGARSLWVSDRQANRLTRLNPK